MRKIPSCPQLEENINVSLKRHFSIKVITSMVGGGSVAGQIDLSRTIRPSAVRGNLRFWWRATRGAQYKSYSELLSAENEIWGSTNTPSLVTIEVINSHDMNNDKNKQNITNVKGTESYVYYPFSEKNNKMGNSKTYKLESHVAEGRLDFSFELIITINGLEREALFNNIEPAIWAWVNFGGIGARTRKGLGSLYCADYAPKNINTEDVNKIGELIISWYVDSCLMFNLATLQPDEIRSWPVLPLYINHHDVLKKYLIAKIRDKPFVIDSAWASGIKLYKKFRQCRNNMNSNKPGRSYWPEADSIRTITRLGAKTHEEKYPRDKKFNIGFPKAELGLPIVYQFKSDNEFNNKKLMLRLSENTTRLASPFIIKALALNTEKPLSAVSLYIRFAVANISEAVFVWGDKNKYLIKDIDIHGELLSEYEKSPLKTTKPISALNALSEFMK